jgi:hypothetical protein
MILPRQVGFVKPLGSRLGGLGRIGSRYAAIQFGERETPRHRVARACTGTCFLAFFDPIIGTTGARRSALALRRPACPYRTQGTGPGRNGARRKVQAPLPDAEIPGGAFHTHAVVHTLKATGCLLPFEACCLCVPSIAHMFYAVKSGVARRSSGSQCLLQVCDQFAGVLEADGEADQAVTRLHPCLPYVVRRDLGKRLDPAKAHRRRDHA